MGSLSPGVLPWRADTLRTKGPFFPAESPGDLEGLLGAPGDRRPALWRGLQVSAVPSGRGGARLLRGESCSCPGPQLAGPAWEASRCPCLGPPRRRGFPPGLPGGFLLRDLCTRHSPAPPSPPTARAFRCTLVGSRA